MVDMTPPKLRLELVVDRVHCVGRQVGILARPHLTRGFHFPSPHASSVIKLIP